MFCEYDINEKASLHKFKQDLFRIINLCQDRTIIFYFIGTDVCTGDSLGPLTGENFKNQHMSNILFYGSLEYPVHALNLEIIAEKNKELYKDAVIIAVDATLDTKDNVGKVYLKDEPLKPGSALEKNIKEIGDYSITAVVNYSGCFDFYALQNTRLYNVYNLSHFITKGIEGSIHKLSKKKLAEALK